MNDRWEAMEMPRIDKEDVFVIKRLVPLYGGLPQSYTHTHRECEKCGKETFVKELYKVWYTFKKLSDYDIKSGETMLCEECTKNILENSFMREEE